MPLGVGVPVCLRFRRGRALGSALRVGGGVAFLHDGVSAPCPVGLPVLERWQFFLKAGFLLSYKSDQKFQAKLSVSTMFHRITVGLKGGILRVASVAERLLKLGGRAPRCGRACPALGGLLVVFKVGSCW